MVKLQSITESEKPEKKLKATFLQDNGRTKTVHFGAKGMTDHTKTPQDEERKKRYLARHAKNENWNDPMSAGALSRWILWNKPTLSASIADYKKRFNL
jgi:hypothetical protein